MILYMFVIFVTDQVHELFSKGGDVKRIIIGLDKVKKTACGFCFVEYPFKYEAHRKNIIVFKVLYNTTHCLPGN